MSQPTERAALARGPRPLAVTSAPGDLAARTRGERRAPDERPLRRCRRVPRIALRSRPESRPRGNPSGRALALRSSDGARAPGSRRLGGERQRPLRQPPHAPGRRHRPRDGGAFRRPPRGCRVAGLSPPPAGLELPPRHQRLRERHRALPSLQRRPGGRLRRPLRRGRARRRAFRPRRRSAAPATTW